MKIHQKKNIRWNGIVRREVKEKEYFSKILNGSASYMDLTAALEKLSKMLAIYYRVAPIIINEYDTPIQEGYSKDFYNEIINFMRIFFSEAFKDNRNLSYGFLTGILRIAQESIFSGLNNLSVNSIMDEDGQPARNQQNYNPAREERKLENLKSIAFMIIF